MPKSVVEAKVVERSKTLRLIDDPDQIQLALNGHLDHEGRRLLVVRGGDSNAIAFQIYHRFSQEKGSQGESFRFSSKVRGLIHLDAIFHQPKRVSGSEFLEYLNRWFIPCELVNNASSGSAIVLLDEFYKFFVAHNLQGRLAGLFSDLFGRLD